MRSKEFRSLVETANSVVGPKAAKKPLNESAQYQNLYEGLSTDQVNLVESISTVLEQVEAQLGIELTEQEIQESTQFIIESATTDMLVEQIQKDVGFELNEEEVNYVLTQLRG
jgi:hypothetical protein